MNESAKVCGEVEPKLTISGKERELTEVLTEMQDIVNVICEGVIGLAVVNPETPAPSCLDQHIGMNLELAKSIREKLKDLKMAL